MISRNFLSIRNVLGALVFCALAAAIAPSAAHASTAANTAIKNVAKVTYLDAGSTPQTASSLASTVTVQLVAAKPNLDDAPLVEVKQGGNSTLVYRLTAAANGPDTYTISLNTADTNVTGVTEVGPAPIVLGGTTLAADAAVGAKVLTVAYDNTGSSATAGDVNGLTVGNDIVIGGQRYQITVVDESQGATDNVAFITIKPYDSNNALVDTGLVAAFTAGQLVVETTTFNVTAPSGDVTGVDVGGNPNSFGTHVTTATATTTGTDASGKTLSDTGEGTVRVTRATLQVSKTVALSTNATITAATFAATANAKPTDTLVYRVVVKNTGASAASTVVVTDVLSRYLVHVGNPRVSVGTTVGDFDPTTPVVTTGYTFTADATRATGGTVTYTPAAALAPGDSLVLYFDVNLL